MRIGIITGEYPPLQGGVGAYTDVLSQVLSARGHDIFILSESRARQQHDTIPLAQHHGWGITAIGAIRKWIDDNRLDIVNLQFQTAAFKMSPVIHFLPHFVSVPFITTFHDLRYPYLFPKAGKLRFWTITHLARASTGVVVTNNEDHQNVAHLPCVEVIPIGSNILTEVPADYDKNEWREKAGASENDFLLAYFGFINHSKGVDVLLHALAELNQPHIKLVMIGGRTGTADPTNAAYADSIDKLIVKLNLSDRITWTGFVDDAAVSAYLKAADVVVLPFRDGASYRRGSLMAAIQHDCAIITTWENHPHPDSLFNRQNMYFTSISGLGFAIKTLAESPLLRQNLRQGTKLLKQSFDWQSIANRYENLFERLLGEQSV